MNARSYCISRHYAAALLFFSLSILRGQTIYVGPDNGDWLTAANWSAGLPASGNDATISGGKIVKINGTLHVNFNIQSFGTVVNAGTTTINNSFAFISGGAIENIAGAHLTIAAGASMTSSGGLTNAGTLLNQGNVNSNSPLINDTRGVINNESSFSQFAAATNAGIVNNKGTFSCPQPFTNNKTINNQTGGTWIVDFGGSLLNETSAELVNAGTLRNFSTFDNEGTMTNTGAFANFSMFNNIGTFNNEDGGTVESTATINLSGVWNNKANSILTTAFRFNILANAPLSNAGRIINRDQIDIRANGRLTSEAGSQLLMSFGSSLLNAGTVWQKMGSQIVSNGEINNSRTFTNDGLIDNQDGSKLINSSQFKNTGRFKSINILNNSADVENSGSIECGGGNVWTNTGKVVNLLVGTIINEFDIFNEPTGEFINNGKIDNRVRITNKSTKFTNNGFFTCSGDLLNKPSAIFTNNEIVEVIAGAIVNEGSFLNKRTLLIQKCGILSNKGSLNNTGYAESSGIVFQLGSWLGTPIVQVTGLIKTNTNPETPNLCRSVVRAGTDLTGKAKVDAPAVILPNIGLDSCMGFQYAINGSTRSTLGCADIGTRVPSSIRIILRTGDELTCSTQIEVFDGVAPLITGCPQSVTLLTSSNSASYSWNVAATDNCGGTPTITTTHTSGTNFPIGTADVIIKATDASRNAGECRFKVTVVRTTASGPCTTPDNTAPVFINCPKNITANVSLPTDKKEVTWVAPSATDACLPIRLTSNFPSGQNFPVGTHTVVYTATDANNNSSTCSFTVNVVATNDPCVNDTIKPVFSNCLRNFFAPATAANNGAFVLWTPPSVSDNCSTPTVSSNKNPGAFLPIGLTTVTYTAVDAAENTATCVFNITVAINDPCPGDVTPPSFTPCPKDTTITIETGNSYKYSWREPTVYDACEPFSFTQTHRSGFTFPLGDTRVTYTAQDGKGNVGTCSFKVTINPPYSCDNDSAPPTILNCPSSQVLTAHDIVPSVKVVAKWWEPIATDDCTATPELSSDYESGTEFPIGTTTVVYTARDFNNNKSTCSFTIRVRFPCDGDVSVPTFHNCPRDISVTTTTNTATPYWDSPAASDNCLPPFVTINYVQGYAFPIGVTTVIYTATDINGNKGTCSFNVIVRAANPCDSDSVKPVFANCPANITLTTNTNSAIATWTAPTATDNCGTSSIVRTHESGASFPVGTTPVSYTATDAKGNSATCSFNVTVQSTTTTSTDIRLSIVSDISTFKPFTTVKYTITAQNISSQAASDVKISFPFPEHMVTGGAAIPSAGTWEEFCVGSGHCYEWRIPSLAAGASATLEIPLFILFTKEPIMAIAGLTGSTPADNNATNNVADVTITPVPEVSNFNRYVPSQRVPIVIYEIFPIPTVDELSIRLNSLSERETTFYFYDLAGREVHVEKRAVEKGVNTLMFNVLGFAQGTYMVVPSTNVGKGTPIKFVKM
jgi:HYR domain/Domain of unknown function DUF11